jgi:hypothetical protein
LFEKEQRLAQIVACFLLVFFRPKERSQGRALVYDIGFNRKIGKQGASVLCRKLERRTLPGCLNSAE